MVRTRFWTEKVVLGAENENLLDSIKDIITDLTLLCTKLFAFANNPRLRSYHGQISGREN